MKKNNTLITSGYTAQDDRDDINVFFVHKELDDLGLDPYSFRVYARIVRRAGKGEAFESNKNMAAGCRMSEKQVKRSLAVLVQYGLITKEPRPGTTCIYRVAPKRNWSSPIPPDSKTSTDNSSRPTEGCELVKDDTQTCTDRSGIPTEGYVSVVDDTNSCTDRSGRSRGVGLVDLGGGSVRPRGVGLVDPLSNSLLSKSNQVTPSLSVGVEEKKPEQEQEQEQASVQDPITHIDSSSVRQNQDPAIMSKSTHEDKNCAAPPENDSQSQRSDDPELWNEFCKWQGAEMNKGKETTPAANLRSGRNWTKKYPEDAIAVFEQWKKDRATASKRSRYASYSEEQHAMMLRGYQSAIEKAGRGQGVFLDQFLERDGGWLEWVKANHPEWLQQIAA